MGLFIANFDEQYKRKLKNKFEQNKSSNRISLSDGRILCVALFLLWNCLDPLAAGAPSTAPQLKLEDRQPI